MNDGYDTDDQLSAERVMGPTPVPTTDIRYATREATLSPNMTKARYKDVFISDEIGWFHIKNLDDREYSRLTSRPMRTSGQLDKVEAEAQDARLIIATCVDPVAKTPIYNDNDLKTIRSWDAAITLKLAYEIRQHIGVPEEGEAKK